ncbi:MAG: hypothetical protein KC418_20375 [Anaerolineales bacterium]|nr:hypothetical protein [Anaerolineales bacterium]MCB8954304.1 hypothetical protein [Ardenticatenales bacterium]
MGNGNGQGRDFNRLINEMLDKTSNFLAARPGLLPLVGIGLILLNWLLQIFVGTDYWLVDSNFFLHLGLIVALLGLLLIKPLG